jgi:hypothetical protein
MWSCFGRDYVWAYLVLLDFCYISAGCQSQYNSFSTIYKLGVYIYIYDSELSGSTSIYMAMILLNL